MITVLYETQVFIDSAQDDTKIDQETITMTLSKILEVLAMQHVQSAMGLIPISELSVTALLNMYTQVMTLAN